LMIFITLLKAFSILLSLDTPTRVIYSIAQILIKVFLYMILFYKCPHYYYLMQPEAIIAGNRNGINKLHIGMLEGVNLADFPEGRTHYLAYALQFGLKLPSVKTMNRCERKNRAKAGADKADKITGRIIVPVVRRKKFNITTRYGD